MFTEAVSEILQKLRDFRSLFLQKGPVYLVSAAEALEKAAEIARMASKFIKELDESLKSGAADAQALAQSDQFVAIDQAVAELRSEIEALALAEYTAMTPPGDDAVDGQVSAQADWRSTLVALLLKILEELMKQINK